MRLYLMRHATAAPHGSSPHDADRPLTEAGRAEARAVAQGLKRLKVEPTHILASPYLRAQETASAVQGVLGAGIPIKELSWLVPEADPRQTSQALKLYEGLGDLLCVGHEPHLSRWLADLVTTHGDLQCIMKKAGVAGVELDRLPPQHGQGILRWFMTPKHLSLIAKAT